MNRLTVHLFGRLAVECGPRLLGARDFGGIKPRQILEILLLARGRAVPKDRLADLLWGELLPKNVSGTLETYVSVLRRHLSPEGREGHALIITEPEAYRFAADRVDIDLDRFDELVDAAANAEGSEARTQLEAAIALARGDVLEDEPYAEWVLPVRDLYRERLLLALADAASAALAEGDYEAALAHAEAAIQLDSADERAYRIAMLACYALDRRQDALRAFERCRRALAEILELTPSPETESLHAGIRRHESLAFLLGGKAEVDARQATSNGAERATWLVGRGSELDALEAAVTGALAGTFALVFVEGEAKIGKSRLLDAALSRLRGARAGRGRCTQLERNLPYAALASAVRDALDGVDIEPSYAAALGPILPELGLGRAPRASVARALEALVAVVRRAAPLVLALEDLHLADPATITALGYLARRCGDVSLAVVATVRPDELPRDDPLRELEPSLRIRLGPLSPRELGAAGLGALYERTGGYPLLVSALAAGDGELPPEVAEHLLDRCRAEGLFAHQLLAAASVLEQPFSPELLAVAFGVDLVKVTEELEQLCERALLQPEGVCYGFRFQVLREVLHQSVSPFRRVLLADRARDARLPHVSGNERAALTVTVS